MELRSILAVFVLVSATSAWCADVTWEAAQDITGPSDIITTGTLVDAVNADNGAATVVEPAGLNMTFRADNTLFPTQNPFTTSFAPSSGDPGFDAIMNRADWDGTSPNATVVSVGGLSPGENYAIQLFVSDTRGCCNTRSMEITGGANTAAVFMGNVGGAPNRAQFVVGKFTADAATQQLTFTGTHATGANLRHPQLNAYVLRTDPAATTTFTGAVDGDLGNPGNWDEGLPTNDGSRPGTVPDGFPALSGDPDGKRITFAGESGYDGGGFGAAGLNYSMSFGGTGDSNFAGGGISLEPGSAFSWESAGTATATSVSVGGQLRLTAGALRQTDAAGAFDFGGGSLAMTGGVLEVAADLSVGDGTVVQSAGDVVIGGSLILGAAAVTTGQWEIAAGSVQAGSLALRAGVFNFATGSAATLRLLHSAQGVAEIEALVVAGQITTADPFGLRVSVVDVAGTAFTEVRIASPGAAAVTWDEPQNITGPADILTTGELVAAVNADNGGDVIVDPGGLNMTFTPDNTMFPTQNPFTTSFAPGSGDAGFDAIMDRADWDGTSPNATEVVIGGLAPGQAYAIQFFVSDTRGCCNTRSMEITGGGNTANVFMGDVGGAPNPAQYVVGRFVAEESSQTFSFTGTHASAGNLRHPQLNAYVLRTDVPATPLRFTSVSYDPANRTAVITWDSLPDHRYLVEASTDMQRGWFELDDNFGSGGDETTYMETDVPAGVPRRYYRVTDVGR